jgi:hypothetical protein
MKKKLVPIKLNQLSSGDYLTVVVTLPGGRYTLHGRERDRACLPRSVSCVVCRCRSASHHVEGHMVKLTQTGQIETWIEFVLECPA